MFPGKNEGKIHLVSPQLRLTLMAETQNKAWKLLKFFKAALWSTISKNNMPTYIRKSNSKEPRTGE